jgi:hypothetical protein
VATKKIPEQACRVKVVRAEAVVPAVNMAKFSWAEGLVLEMMPTRVPVGLFSAMDMAVLDTPGC